MNKARKARKFFLKTLKNVREGKIDLKAPMPGISGALKGSSENGEKMNKTTGVEADPAIWSRPWGQPQYGYDTQYNYKCPDCSGEFNFPAAEALGSNPTYKCPFCGRVMEGMP